MQLQVIKHEVHVRIRRKLGNKSVRMDSKNLHDIEVDLHPLHSPQLMIPTKLFRNDLLLLDAQEERVQARHASYRVGCPVFFFFEYLLSTISDIHHKI